MSKTPRLSWKTKVLLIAGLVFTGLGIVSEPMSTGCVTLGIVVLVFGIALNLE